MLKSNVDKTRALYRGVVGDLRRFGALLREWRERHPAAEQQHTGGLTGARRTPGLRREEVAERSGVSADYVKRLEQGRARPSAQVLAAIADALAVSEAEYAHLCILTGHVVARPGPVNRRLRPATEQLLDRLRDVPVAVFDATWTLVCYNALGAALCGDPGGLTYRDRNMAWRYFTGTTNCAVESAQDADEWEAALVADLRTAASLYPNDGGLCTLTTTLRTTNARFAALWADGASTTFQHRRGIINHPSVGRIQVDGNALTTPNEQLKLLVFTAEPGSEDADRLAALKAAHNKWPPRAA